ncbi:MAG TPA: hypothetical protein V6C65_10960 [Allocoleopsis sp.]
MKRILPIAFLSLFATACQSPLVYSISDPSPTTAPSSDAKTQENWTSAQADRLIETAIVAINQNQPNTLLPYLLQRDQELENAQAAIEDFKTYFRGEPIQRFERLPDAVQEGVPQRFTYRLYSASGISKILSVYCDSHQDPPVRLMDEFLLYSRWVQASVDRYVTALQAQDSVLLASALTADDLPYPVAGAAKTIDSYAAKFDLQTLQYQFIGLDTKRDRFIYRISGTKAEQPVSHVITVRYGDGLVSLEDEFVLPREAFISDAP